MPPVRELISTIEQFGSPLEDRLVTGIATSPSAEAYEAAVLIMIGRGFRVEHGTEEAGAPIPIEVVETPDAVVTPTARCIRTSRSTATVDITVSVQGGPAACASVTSGRRFDSATSDYGAERRLTS
jgi:hypothetical protein